MHKKVLVVGSLNVDLVVQLDRFHHEGETVLGKSMQQLIGGKGANQASAISAQGIATGIWGYVGYDSFGDSIIEQIEVLNIRSFVQRDSVNTGVALIETDISGKNRIVVVSGANGEFGVNRAQEQLDILDDFDIIVVQFEIPIPTVEYIIRESKKKSKIVIVNPAPALLISDELFQEIDYIIPNEHELALITGCETKSQVQVENAVVNLHERGSRSIIVTLGDKGVYFSTQDYREFLPCYNVHPVDTTGAGDAFVGGLAGALARGMDVVSAVHHANKVAAVSVTKIGAFNSAGTYEDILNLK